MPNFRVLTQVVPEKSLTEKNVYMYYIREKEGKKQKFPLERKKNEQIKGLISNMWLFFCYTIQLSLSSFVPNFRVLTQVVPEKSLTEKNVYMYYIREKEGKNENLKKEGKMRISILIFIYTVHFGILKVYTKFENTGSNRS